MRRKIKDYLLHKLTSQFFKTEFEEQGFIGFNERPVEFRFIFKKLGEIYPHKILDVGSGITALPRLMRDCGFLVTAIDNVQDYWSSGMINRYYHVIDDNITDTNLTEQFDIITCVSVVEHIKNADVAVKNMFSLLKPNGHLIMTFPYSEYKYIRNVYERPESVCFGKELPYITQSFSRTELDLWMRDNNGVILDQEWWQIWEGEYWSEGEELIPPKQVEYEDNHQHTCVHIQKRLD